MFIRNRAGLVCLALALCLPGNWAAANSRNSTASRDLRGEALDLMTAAAAAEARGNKAQAVQLYRQSLALAPSPAAWYHLGRTLASQGKKTEALAAYDSALALSPQYETARVARERLRRGAADSQIDLVALEREAETAHSLVETGVQLSGDSPVTLAQSTPERARSGVAIPDPPRRTASPPSVAPPRQTPDVTSPAIAERDDLARPHIVVPNSQPVIWERGGKPTLWQRMNQTLRPSTPAGQSATPEPPSAQPAAPQRPQGQTLTRRPQTAPGTPSSTATPAETPEAGGAARTQNPEGGRTPSVLGRLGLSRQIPPAAPLSQNQSVAGHDAAAINTAAFQSEAANRKSSVGYGQPTGTAALGTFAFHRDRGDEYRNTERWADARNEYEYALRQAPGDAETRALLGEMQARTGDERRALRNLNQAAKDAPALAAVPYRRGNALRALKQNDQAIGAYLDAIRLEPRHAEALNNLGVTYMETNRPDRAASTFERLLAAHPNHPNALMNLGILYEDSLSDPKKAAEYYERYLQLSDAPRKTEVRRWLNLLNRR
jgi:tetratricopeptide (TPR) repeat protein